jgi:hypothetical protein
MRIPIWGLYKEIVRMDIVTILFAGLQVIFGLLSLFFIPGFVITLVYFPQLVEIGIIPRLIYSVVFSIGFVIATVVFLVGVLGVDTSSRNVYLVVAVFLALMLVTWLFEVFSLNKTIRKNFSRIINATRDRFTPTAMTVVVWHENVRSGRNQNDHTYLIDVSEEIEIQQVDEYKWKISDDALVPPPYPRTRYFELFIREYKEDGLSLIDDLQVYPVLVTKKPDIKFLRFILKRGSSIITERLYKKDRMTEIQWIYSHDFHLFAIIHSQDTLGQMVDRILVKLDEIATSIKKGSRVSSHVENTQKLKDEFDVVLEKPRRIPTSTVVSSKSPEPRIFAHPTEIDRRKLQTDIVRDLKVTHVTPATFRSSDRMITRINIPEKADITKQFARIKEILDDDWLYE